MSDHQHLTVNHLPSIIDHQQSVPFDQCPTYNHILDPLSTPVVISVNPWTSSALNANIAKILLEEAVGITTQLVDIGEYEQWPLLSTGEISACLENWPSGHVADDLLYVQQLRTVEVAGPLGVIGQIGWYIEDFVLDYMPGAAVSRSFTNPDITAIFNHTFYLGDSSWTSYDQQIINQYNYSLDVVILDGEDPTIAFLGNRYRDNIPMLFYWWSPHGIFAEFSLFRVSLPPLAEEYDYPPDILTKIMHSHFRDISPSGSFLISTFALHTYDQINLLHLVMSNVSIEDAACQWVRNNTVTWSNWILPLPNLVAFVEWNSAIGIIAVILSVIVLILSVTSLIGVVIYKDHPNIRASGYMLVLLILIGSMFMAVAPLGLIGFATNVGCALAIFLFGIGFAMMWGAVLLKEYRIYRIFKLIKKLKKNSKNYSDVDMIKLLIPIILIEVIIDIIWVTVTPIITTYGQCQPSSSVVISVFVFYKVVLLLIACVMAILTRNMSTKFSESKSLMIGIYAFTLLLVIVMVLTLFLSVVGIIFAVTVGIEISLLSFLIPVFGMKAYVVFTVNLTDTDMSEPRRSAVQVSTRVKSVIGSVN